MSGDRPDAIDQLKARIDALEDRQKQLEQGAVDARGRKWTLSDFLSLGLTRRQAMGVLGSLAAGMTLSGALTQTVLAQPDGSPSVIGKETDRTDLWADQIDANVVDTKQFDITNESLVDVRTDASVSISSSGTWKSPSFGTENKDERDEFASDQFTPDSTGWYLISGYGEFEGTNMADGDTLASRVQNVTDSTTVFRATTAKSSGTDAQGPYPVVCVVELVASKAYEFQMANFNNATNIASVRGGLFIRSMFRG